MWLASSAAVVGLQLGALSLPIEVVEGKESVVELSRLPGIAVLNVIRRFLAFVLVAECRIAYPSFFQKINALSSFFAYRGIALWPIQLFRGMKSVSVVALSCLSRNALRIAFFKSKKSVLVISCASRAVEVLTNQNGAVVYWGWPDISFDPDTLKRPYIAAGCNFCCEF